MAETQESNGEERRERTPQPALRLRLGIISFGLGCGVTAALYAFVLAITAGLFGWGAIAVQVLANLFIGYGPSFVGAVAGAVWAFVDAFVAGCLIAFFYNRFLVERH